MSDKAPKDREQKSAEAAVEEFKRNLGPFVTATETTRMAMAFTDARKADHLRQWRHSPIRLTPNPKFIFGERLELGAGRPFYLPRPRTRRPRLGNIFCR